MDYDGRFIMQKTVDWSLLRLNSGHLFRDSDLISLGKTKLMKYPNESSMVLLKKY